MSEQTIDSAALTSRAWSLLSGRDASHDVQEGMSLLTRAVERGNADAMAIMATLSGAGVWGVRQDWNRALDLLAAGAEGRSEDARSQLVLLSTDAALVDCARQAPDAPGVWKQLRASVDLEKWVIPPPPKQVCDWPKIWIVEKFASPEICAWLIGRGLGKFTPSMMFTGQKAVFHATRTCSDFSFSLIEGGVVLLLLRTRVSIITGQGTEQMEPPQIFHYATGQGIDAHYDSLYDGEHSYGRDGTYKGDRLATLLMYLNDDYDGGVLQFVRVGYTYRGKTGDALFFASLREGKRDEKAEHGATTVTRGEKFIFSQWIHDRPFTA